MKKLLLVLLVLGLSVPAIADVFVYNSKQSGVEFEFDSDQGAWSKSTLNRTAYIVVQVDGNDLSSVNLWAFHTWTAKDPDTNKMTKYYTLSSPGNFNFLQAAIANKNMWIVEGTSSDLGSSSVHIMVSGQTKSTKIGTTPYTIAATLSGYVITGDIADDDVTGSTMSLTINSNFTKVLVSSDADGGDVGSAISDYLENTLGYQLGSDD